MRILMCTHHHLDRRLGAPKVSIELAEAMREVGADCELAGPGDYGAPAGQDAAARVELASRLREFLWRGAGEFDVVEYDHEDLPFARREFSPRPLMVARSVLLVHHLETIQIPQPQTARALAGRLVRGRQRRDLLALRIEQATQSIEQADLVNVSNHHDKAELVRRGIAAEKITVQPFGLSAQRRRKFEQACSAAPPAQPVVAFVGTFDYRKGALDFPGILQSVCEVIPKVRFKLLGTAGLMRTAADVLRFFPRDLRGRIDVQPQFDPDELPALLADCSVGVFPSYCEGFGFGVLEMLAAAVPVIAYDAPGPPMMLAQEYLVPSGDVVAMAGKVVDLLKDPSRLAAARTHARELSRPFNWGEIAQRTMQIYQEALAGRRWGQ